ncbi:hypothetical protein DEO72_LG3g1433 [Vigna unguiculata]|uniref:Uncharacterized protein n=1 Tax=Vigna unguiculata TaxID=3917 RepID=A0A4D6LFA6_VIGUN|nr:hypothetical protein DEO72_LG3g1433 [Vigna unguiculata]
MGSYRPRHWTPEHSSSGDGSGTGVTAAQKEEQSHQPTLNGGIRRRKVETIGFRVTYVVQEVGLSLSLKEGDLRVNPNRAFRER